MSASLPKHSPCLGVVLAGGLSRRMGQDKAKLPHFNQRQMMLEFAKENLLAAGVNDVVVSGQGYDVEDKFSQLGPLAAIYSVIQTCMPMSLLVLPVDLPLMTHSTLKQLKVSGELSQKASFFQSHFLPLYLPNNAYSELFFTQAFTPVNKRTSKGPAMKDLLASIPHQAIATQAHDALLNCNTPSDWQQAQQLYTKC